MFVKVTHNVLLLCLVLGFGARHCQANL